MQAHELGRARRHLDLYEDCAAQVPGLAMCAHSRTTHAVGDELWAGLQIHHHPGWEIHWIAAGAVEWWAEGMPATDLGAFWCHVIPPGMRHGAVTGMLEPCELWWLQLDPARLDIPARHRAQITAGLRDLPMAFPVGDLRADWEGLAAAVVEAGRHPAGSLPSFHASTRLAQLLTRILLEQRRLSLSPALAGLLAQADHPQVGIPQLARAAGCSVSSLHRLFRHDLGISPAAWLRRQRINLAKRQLRAGDDDITAIARRLRFASSQQLATQFRQITGITPSEYRRRAAGLRPS